MKKLLLLVVSLVMTGLLLYSQDYIHLYQQNADKPVFIPINEIKYISHDEWNNQNIGTKTAIIETPISEIDSLVFSSIHLCPDDKHPHIINLGLPSGTLWSCCNVGASSPEAYGGYYSWGETEEKKTHTDVSYKYATGEDTDGDGWYDDYHSEDDVYGIWQDLGDNIAGTQYDVAHVKWGNDWRMPNYYELEELINNCTYVWVTVNGVNGGMFTSKTNGKSIFMPAAGYHWEDSLEEVGSKGWFWSSTQHQDRVYAASPLFLDNSIATYWGWCDRGCGNSVRPVYDPWFFTTFSLSEDTVDVFVNSTASVVIETGRGMYELQSENTDIMDAEMMMIDKEKYPDGKDEILIYGISEGSAEIKVLNKRINQTATLVVNVKMPTDEDVTITKQYSESVRDYVNLQEEMPIEDFQNKVISWLDSQSYVKKTVLSPNRDLITITFNNGAIFRIDFQDMSFFDENEDNPSYAPTMASDNKSSYDVSYQTGEKILDNANILLIQGREMPGDNSYWEYEDLKNIISPVNVKWTLQKHTLRVFEKGLSSYGMICISQTHGFSNRVGGFQVQDNNAWSNSNLNPAITQYVKNKLIYKRTDEQLIFDIYPNLFKELKINNNAIIHGAYCWSYGLDYKLPEQAFFGYLTESSYGKNREYLYSFTNDLLNGKTYDEVVSELKNYPWFDLPNLKWQYTIVKKDNSKQRYFSISTEYVREYSETGNPFIKGKINGYSNLKSGINYYVYVFDKDEELNPSDITTGKPITINPDGTFKYEYSDSQITQYPEKYKFVVGFDYKGIIYYGPILDLKDDGLCPDNNHPHAIDLGLPSGTKWACCNVDTSHPENQRPTNRGGHYAWGETREKSRYTNMNYSYATGYDFDDNGWADGGYEFPTRFQDLGESICGTVYDVAHVKWADNWQMPSQEQIQELGAKCSSQMIELDGIKGKLFIGPNGNHIFMPCAGYACDYDIYHEPNFGAYWSGTTRPPYGYHSDNSLAYWLEFSSGNFYDGYWYYNQGCRDLGLSVRPVCP